MSVNSPIGRGWRSGDLRGSGSGDQTAADKTQIFLVSGPEPAPTLELDETGPDWICLVLTESDWF